MILDFKNLHLKPLNETMISVSQSLTLVALLKTNLNIGFKQN